MAKQRAAKKTAPKAVAPKPAPKPEPQPAPEPEAVVETRAPAKTPTPAQEPVVEQAPAVNVDAHVALLSSALEVHGEAVEAGGGLNPDLPGSAFKTAGHRFVPDLDNIKWAEAIARKAAGEDVVVPDPHTVVLYLQNGQMIKHRLSAKTEEEA